MAEVSLVVDIATKKAVKDLNKLESELADIGKQSKKTGKDTDKSFSLISKGAAGAAVAVAAIGSSIFKAVDEAKKIEDLETSFISFTGSAESAAAQIDRLADFAASTPFQLEALATANRTLLAFGSSTEESISQLKNLGEASAATGSSITELSTIFGQIQATGRLTGERFNQLVERGINIGPTLAKSLGVAESSLEDLRRQGKISSEEVAKAFETLANTQFAGALERQSKTLSGSISTLDDNIDALAASIGKTLTPVIVFIVGELTNAARVTKAFFESLQTKELTALEKKISDTKNSLAEYVDELINLKEDSKAANVAEGEYADEIEKTKEKIKSLTESLKKFQAARRTEPTTDLSDNAELEKEKVIEIEDEKNQAKIDSVRKLNDELAQLAQQRIAIEAVGAQEENAKLSEQLDIKREIILEKEKEKFAALLEANGQFEEAAKIQAQNNLDKIESDEKSSRAKRLSAAKQASKDEINLAKIKSDEEIKFEEKSNLGKAKALSNGLANLEALQKTGSKEAFQIGKAAALARAAIALPETALQAFKSGVGIGGPPLGAAFAAAATAVQLANIRNIQSQKFTAFAEGGVVPGIGNNDSVASLLTPGEVVVPKQNFSDINQNNGETVSELKKLNTNISDLILNGPAATNDNAIAELKRLNTNIQQQNQVLLNISASTNDTSLGTQEVAAGVANIALSGPSNDGSGDALIERVLEIARIRTQQIRDRERGELLGIGDENTTTGTAKIDLNTGG